MKTPFLAMCLIVANVSVMAQEGVKIMPLPRVAPDKVLTADAARKPHVLFLNVGRAVDEALFREAVAAVSLVMPINLKADAMAAPLPREKLWERGYTEARHGNAKLVVYVCGDPKDVAFINAPGFWSMINVSGLDRDKPDAARFSRRLRQMMLKGLAQACGVGASGDYRCVMYYKSFTLEGLDNVSVSYSPFASAPVQGMLLAIGGEAIFRMPEEEESVP
jgi:hypothetical protein